jgi:hypothetical protein
MLQIFKNYFFTCLEWCILLYESLFFKSEELRYKGLIFWAFTLSGCHKNIESKSFIADQMKQDIRWQLFEYLQFEIQPISLYKVTCPDWLTDCWTYQRTAQTIHDTVMEFGGAYSRCGQGVIEEAILQNSEGKRGKTCHFTYTFISRRKIEI